tara:strand:+ start:285 stop:554 length:270 start_codon:yes stop_codon:yes gene_type:complete
MFVNCANRQCHAIVVTPEFVNTSKDFLIAILNILYITIVNMETTFDIDGDAFFVVFVVLGEVFWPIDCERYQTAFGGSNYAKTPVLRTH